MDAPLPGGNRVIYASSLPVGTIQKEETDMLYIRADMNDTIATGHVMRCLAVAEAARLQGEEVMFLLADSQAVSILEKRGFAYTIFHTRWDDMESELPSIWKALKEVPGNILIDSYQVTPSYLEGVAGMARTAYIDDVNAFYYPVDILICYGNQWQEFQYESRYPDTRLLLGASYAPLRQCFSNPGKKQIKPQAERLILLSGGTDHHNILGRTLEHAAFMGFQDIDVICGAYNVHYDSLRQEYASHKGIHIQKNVADIERYMANADLAVAAGGTTLYELCAFGVPTISYSIADNQTGSAKKFHKERIIDYAGCWEDEGLVGRICQYLECYKENQALRQERSQNMQSLIDGQGAMRIARELINYPEKKLDTD